MECTPIIGNEIERKVTWEDQENLSSLQGRTVRLIFEMRDCDLYSFQFR
jgi:hypothetical protein